MIGGLPLVSLRGAGGVPFHGDLAWDCQRPPELSGGFFLRGLNA